MVLIGLTIYARSTALSNTFPSCGAALDYSLQLWLPRRAKNSSEIGCRQECYRHGLAILPPWSRLLPSGPCGSVGRDSPRRNKFYGTLPMVDPTGFLTAVPVVAWTTTKPIYWSKKAMIPEVEARDREINVEHA